MSPVTHFDADETPHPLGSFEKEEIISYANALLTGANTRLMTGNIAGACWRIADALGALSFAADTDTGGIDRFTGLGFRLLKVNDTMHKASPIAATMEDEEGI